MLKMVGEDTNHGDQEHQPDVSQPNCLFEADSRSFSVAEGWIKCRGFVGWLALGCFQSIISSKEIID
jgi:hypothetical protein